LARKAQELRCVIEDGATHLMRALEPRSRGTATQRREIAPAALAR
jgi:hypothetical protein